MTKADVDLEELKSSTVRGSAITLTRTIFLAALNLLSLPLLARLLSPEDYGIVAMATSVTAMAALLSDVGLGTATIQKFDVDSAYLNSMFWNSRQSRMSLSDSTYTFLADVCPPGTENVFRRRPMLKTEYQDPV